MKKKRNILLITIPLCVIIVVVTLILLLIKNATLGISKNPDGEKIKEEYENLNNKSSEDNKEYPLVKIPINNIMKYSNINEIQSIINNDKDAVIYFGYPSCIYCRSVIEVLVDTSINTELDVIYYIDVEKNQTNEELKNILGEEFTTEDKVYSPLVLFITDGEIVSYNKDTIYSHKDPYLKLTVEEKQALSEIYRYGIEDVVASKKLKQQIK